MYVVLMTEVYRRLTTNLTRRSSEALTYLHETEEMSKTDVINRALQLYQFTVQSRERGENLAVVKSDGSVMKLHLI